MANNNNTQYINKFLFFSAGPKDCDLPKAAITALHAGVNSFGQLPPNAQNPADAVLNGGGGGGGARLHVTGGLCDTPNPHHNNNNNNTNNNNMQQQDQVSMQQEMKCKPQRCRRANARKNFVN